MDVEKIVRGIVVSYMPGNISLDMNATWDDYGFDSLDKVELLVEVERACHVNISDRLAEKIESPADAVECVRGLRARVPEYEILSKSRVETIQNAMCVVRGKNAPVCTVSQRACPYVDRQMCKKFQNVCAHVKCQTYQRLLRVR